MRASAAPPALKLEIIEIDQWPLLSERNESARPKTWSASRQTVGAGDTDLLVIPECNTSLLAVLKNERGDCSRHLLRVMQDRDRTGGVCGIGSLAGRRHIVGCTRSKWRERSPAAVICVLKCSDDTSARDVRPVRRPARWTARGLVRPARPSFLPMFLESFTGWFDANVEH